MTSKSAQYYWALFSYTSRSPLKSGVKSVVQIPPFSGKKVESKHLIFGTFYGPRGRHSRLELLETIKIMYQSIAQPLGIDWGTHIAYFGLHKLHSSQSRPFDLAKNQEILVSLI